MPLFSGQFSFQNKQIIICNIHICNYILKRAFFEIETLILPEFVKEPSLTKLVNGTKTGCQSMVNGTKSVLQNWLAEQKMPLIFS
jgi:hypothetical protein